MRVALFAVGLFAATFFCHWLLWRIHLPRRQSRTLLFIFVGALPVTFALSLCWPAASWPDGFWEWSHVALFQIACALAYIVTYSALEENSPTLTIVAFVLAAGPEGRSLQDVYQIINDDLILRSRLQPMIRDGLLTQVDGLYQLTPKGRVWGRVFAMSRTVLSMRKGG